MPDSTEQTIVVNADAAAVMAVIADFERYPEWVSAAREVTVLDTDDDGRATTVRFVLDAGVLRDTYELRYSWSPDGRAVEWDLMKSDLQQAQHGRYELAQLARGSTKVSYALTVDVVVPMIAPLKRRAEKAITDIALHELKKRVEA
ncbi:SRPBCC family protein [Williamsia sterculiae]|uniref:Polyketide cyclase / dehydrase and lipid transport n=1 Tax=Williamsia sterculiae TaxID=1344003 RepID=A0A1N7H7U0_9NOCA|nr:SRPBCC family protein [Williamsia sterculiae]SIS20760.1 Polyketide cyclase / dehydrase and lipid transport [Williamsia sterculiae]